MLLVSLCLIFALARVEKKEKQGIATLTCCKRRALLGYRVQGVGAKLWNKGKCDHVKIKGLTFLTMVEMTNCHKNQRHLKRKVLWSATRWYFLVSWVYGTSLKKKLNFFRNWNASIPEKQYPWGNINLFWDAKQLYINTWENFRYTSVLEA